MAIVKKRYLLKNSIDDFLTNVGKQETNISQFYTQIKHCKEIRFLKSDQRYYKTIRMGNEARKNEVDKEINKKTFLLEKKNKLGHTIKKKRYYIKGYPKEFTVDKYKKHLDNLTILSIYFNTLDDAEVFVLPDDLKRHIYKDVSHDERYRNKHLALLGNPKKIPYNIYAIFKDIELNRITDIKSLLFPEMIVSDAVRIVLYKIYHDLKQNKQRLSEKNDIYALEEFRVNLKKAKILLDEFQHIFNKDMHKKTRLHISLIEKTIAVDKDLTVIRSNMNLLESAFSEKEVNSFISRIDNRIEVEKAKVKNFFKTREFAIIFSQFELLIKEQNNTYPGYHSNTSIGFVIKKTVYRRFKKLLKVTNKYDYCHDLESYRKIKKSLYNTQVLLDNFSSLYTKKEQKKMQTLLFNCLKNILSFMELNKRALIIKTYIRHSDKELQEQHKMIKIIAKKRKSIEKHLNYEIDKSIEELKKNRSLFKR